jgi:hypothetical protein
LASKPKCNLAPVAKHKTSKRVCKPHKKTCKTKVSVTRNDYKSPCGSQAFGGYKNQKKAYKNLSDAGYLTRSRGDKRYEKIQNKEGFKMSPIAWIVSIGAFVLLLGLIAALRSGNNGANHNPIGMKDPNRGPATPLDMAMAFDKGYDVVLHTTGDSSYLRATKSQAPAPVVVNNNMPASAAPAAPSNVAYVPVTLSPVTVTMQPAAPVTPVTSAPSSVTVNVGQSGGQGGGQGGNQQRQQRQQGGGQGQGQGQGGNNP